ncbi:MAG TPA: ATP-binding protein [Gemmatimonadales bacterium]
MRRKRLGRDSKAPAKYPRKGTKVATGHAAPAERKATTGNFALLRAAHRGRMGAVLAGATADRLREIAQVVGLTNDTTGRGKHLPATVIKAMHAADSSLLAQIDALEQFAQPTSDGPSDLAESVDRAVTWCAHVAGRRDAQFLVDLPRRLPAVTLDASDLQEILFALLVNARESDRGDAVTTIRIGAVASEGVVQLSVEDDGPGLSAALRKKVFGPFAPGHNGKTHLGIGLAVARQLARDHGGELQYDARAKGARFVLTMRAWRSGRSVGVRRPLQ